MFILYLLIFQLLFCSSIFLFGILDFALHILSCVFRYISAQRVGYFLLILLSYRHGFLVYLLNEMYFPHNNSHR